MNKIEIILNWIPFFLGFIALGITIIIFRIFPTPYMNYDIGLLTGLVLGILLTMNLFFMAKYQNLKKEVIK